MIDSAWLSSDNRTLLREYSGQYRNGEIYDRRCAGTGGSDQARPGEGGVSHRRGLLADSGHSDGPERAAKSKEAGNSAPCLAAILGDEEGCRARLLRAKEFGDLPAPEQLQTNPDLETMRDKPWFKQLAGL